MELRVCVNLPSDDEDEDEDDDRMGMMIPLYFVPQYRVCVCWTMAECLTTEMRSRVYNAVELAIAITAWWPV